MRPTFYAEGNVKFFIGAKEWFEFMKNMDLLDYMVILPQLLVVHLI